ncbi:hypothetical protein OG413_17800 [Streptomyces sp. NBC_01433]|uniref:hypothetical protein n=1 Tax=Streptomyces sp. NBC_01433 TaxID=2903864 RepID=UPI0022516F71|nr:hypothetical protein [Streptomyces sp. NBC_01433]MCX4677133.1 hypothetical protein [Streptomyces sp. NBC_01433]
MSPQDNTPTRSGGTAVSADRATEALRSVESAREAARLRAGLSPSWYGPAAAAALIVPALGQAWAEERGGWGVPLALVIPLAGLAVVLVLVNAAGRRAEVTVTRSLSARLRRAAVPLSTLLAAGLATWGLCHLFGADRAVTKIALFTVLGLGTWAVFATRNASIGRKLQDIG